MLIRDVAQSDHRDALGETPIDEANVPLGMSRWKFEKDGYETRELLESSAGQNAFARIYPASIWRPPEQRRQA